LVEGSCDELFRDVDEAGAQPLTDRLGLRVESGVGRNALAEDAADEDVQPAEVRQGVRLDREILSFRQQFFDPLGREEVDQPGDRCFPVRGRGGDPDSDVRVATLVA